MLVTLQLASMYLKPYVITRVLVQCNLKQLVKELAKIKSSLTREPKPIQDRTTLDPI